MKKYDGLVDALRDSGYGYRMSDIGVLALSEGSSFTGQDVEVLTTLAQEYDAQEFTLGHLSPNKSYAWYKL